VSVLMCNTKFRRTGGVHSKVTNNYLYLCTTVKVSAGEHVPTIHMYRSRKKGIARQGDFVFPATSIQVM
jgi:arginyl-tRNA--protein-N-Asp/Glu arginylyltransferase